MGRASYSTEGFERLTHYINSLGRGMPFYGYQAQQALGFKKGMIYRMLKKLEDQGYIEYLGVKQEGNNPPRKLYRKV